MNTMGIDVGGADVALLGLLAEGPKHAWDITKEVEYRDMRSWTDLSRSTVYKQLRALEARGLVVGDEGVVAGRARRTYHLTDDGRRALAAGVAAHLRVPEYPHWAIDVATYNVDALGTDDAVAALDDYAATLRERAEGWRALVAFLRDEVACPPHRWALADRALAMIEGELAWVARFRDQVGGAR